MHHWNTFTHSDHPQSSLRRKVHTTNTFWPQQHHNLGYVFFSFLNSHKELWYRLQAPTNPLWGLSQNKCCCSHHQNKLLHQLGDTVSGASVLIKPVLPSAGWDHVAANHEMINATLLRKVFCDGGRWREGRVRWEIGMRVSLHPAEGSGINITAQCSAKYLISPSFDWYLNNQPATQTRPSLLTYLISSTDSDQYADFHCWSHWVTWAMKKKHYIPSPNTFSQTLFKILFLSTFHLFPFFFFF